VVEISAKAVDLIEPALGEPTAEAAGRVFFDAVQDLGVRALNARGQYPSAPTFALKEQIYARLAPPGWEVLYSEKWYQDSNFLPRALRQRASPFKWSDAGPFNAKEQAVWRALADNGFSDGLAAPCHGPDGYMGVVSIGFERLDQVSPADQAAVQFAALVLHDRMRMLSTPPETERPKLTPRERDCMGFIAQGKSDWDISVILGVSHTTIISHVQNAKRKLGATTRAQAVAHCFLLGIL
jgi:LuxR family quorum sensing-dependent transcriptional regulator